MKNFGKIAAVYLVGLFLGGIYVGLIAPLRTVVQADMGIDSSLGIWMINIYTLFYAATIPVSGSLADRYGRKPVFLSCVGLFMLGALACGLSQFAGSFALLLVGRVVSAAGAGGIIPAATAEMGVSAPPQKRGMWLGITAAVAGIANVAGAAVGSLVVGIVGTSAWCWAFFIALPVGVLLLLGGAAWLPRTSAKPQGKLDLVGSALFVVFVVVLLLGLKNLTTPASPMFWAPLIAAVVLAVVFIAVERKAAAPVFHLEYLHSRAMVIIMIVSFFVGCCIISMQLIPEYAEYALGTSTGSGGYYMSIIGVFAIVGPPTCGKLIDRFGAKPVLICGLVAQAVGYLFLATVVANYRSLPLLLIGLAIVGLGMGFTMGTPLNYMTLANTSKEESSSAIATITLARQMGTTIAPAILVSFTVAALGMPGYSHMLMAVTAFSVISILVMLFYREKKAGE